ncbi:Nucleotide-sugar transporter family protein [Theobroma cacao]|uniref:Nucleotide-sugar transporter family protein n=1 Tax=Theobroma cacao TaxID=3641 RepID=A0A061GQT5_THECC|nr:Nucleotide-sugar transporter family protein [Theobroma cacao]
MGKGGSLSDSVIKKILLSYTYVAIWIFLSFTVIVYNKYILDKKMYNWPFPISLTMIHMSFCATLAFLLIKVFKVVEPVSMSRELYLSSVVPIGALYSLSLWLSNSAYIYLSVSFIQMLKALMPVAVYSIGVLFKKESFKSDTMFNMLSISFGVGIAAYGEARFDSWGVILQLGAVAFEATRLVMIQILLTSKGITLNPITSLYYVAPCCLVFLLVPWIFVEFPILKETSSFHFDFVIFGTNSFCAFALNLAVFLLVGKTSALTMNVAGVVKDWLLIAFSWSVIKDTVTPINLFGYGLAFLGVAYYNHSKLQALKAKEAQKKTAQADEEAGRLLEEREGEGTGKKSLDLRAKGNAVIRFLLLFWLHLGFGTPSIDGVLILIYSYMFLSSHPVSSLCLWQCDFGMIILQLYDASGLVVDSLCPFASLNFSS